MSKQKRCTCLERNSPLAKRGWVVRSYFATRVFGRGIRYDGRKLLEIHCLSCNAHWKSYNKEDKLWEVIEDEPYTGPEKVVVINPSKLPSHIDGF